LPGKQGGEALNAERYIGRRCVHGPATGNTTFNGLGGDDDHSSTTSGWDRRHIHVDRQWADRRDGDQPHGPDGFEVFQFKDGTVHNDDSDPLVDDLYYM
jgi:hypothetical protein